MDDQQGTEACPHCLPLKTQIVGLIRRNEVLRRTVRRQRVHIQQFEARLAKLEDRLRELEGPARATAANSSLPPSANPIGERSPVVKKPSGRKIGGQMGHGGHGRSWLPMDEVDAVVAHRPVRCAYCGGRLAAGAKGRVLARHQVMELPARPVVVVEHQAIACCCRRCGKESAGRIPLEVKKSVCAPRLSAMMGYLSARMAVSRRQVAEILWSVLGVKLCSGSVCARERELAEALKEPYLRIAAGVRGAGVVNIDETGWKGAARWLWVGASRKACVYLAWPDRGGGAIERLLGERSRATICSDRFVAYEKYPLQQRGLCWAHLRRDFQRCVDRGGASGSIGREGLEICREVFAQWRQFAAGEMGRIALKRGMRKVEVRMGRLLLRGGKCAVEKTAKLCRRLHKREEALWRFATVEGLEPTNNLAERMLRGAVIWRKKCFGSFSKAGCRFVERMLSVIATLRMRGREVLDYLERVVSAYRLGRPPPAIGEWMMR